MRMTCPRCCGELELTGQQMRAGGFIACPGCKKTLLLRPVSGEPGSIRIAPLSSASFAVGGVLRQDLQDVCDSVLTNAASGQQAQRPPPIRETRRCRMLCFLAMLAICVGLLILVIG